MAVHHVRSLIGYLVLLSILQYGLSSAVQLYSWTRAEVVPFVNSTDGASLDRCLFFHCNRVSFPSNSTYFYDVNWYIDGKLVKTFTKVPYSRYKSDTAFREDNTWQLPMMVKCSYRSRLFRFEDPSPWVVSEEFFAGIKISPEGVITIPEGSSGNVHFQSTIPVPCMSEVHGLPHIDPCIILFENDVNETHGGCTLTGTTTAAQIQLYYQCGFELNGKSWNTSQSINVYAISDGTTGTLSNPALIRLSTDASIPLYPLWRNYKLPEIKVLTEDRNRMTMHSKCTARYGMRVQTFDDASAAMMTYRIDNSGWFLLYNHTEKPIEVMTITESLPEFSKRWGPVNCAVSVKAGNDVYMVFLCQNKYIIKRFGCQDGSKLEVYEKQQGRRTLVILPTGTRVEIEFYSYQSPLFLNIYIYPAPGDHRKVTGLCGNFNGVHDESSSLAQVYRLGDEVNSDDFVQGVLGKLSVNHQICLCRRSLSIIVQSTIYCSWKTGISCTRMNWNVKPCLSRQKRDAHLDEQDWDSGNVVLRKRHIGRVARSTWTLATAQDECLRVLEQYASFNKCRELSGVDISGVLQVCAEDLVKTGDTDWIPGVLEMIKSQCINILDVDVDLWTPTAPGAKSQGEAIFTAAKCPSECHGNGHCAAGVCECKPDFVEEDCSVNLKGSPTVDRLTRNGVCDLSNPETSCSATHVYGSNFYDSPQLKCRITEFMMDENGDRNDSTSTVQTAVFENFHQIMCTFPDTKKFTIPDDKVGVHGYHVEVSNNGVLYSKTLTFIASDPRCHQCDLKNMKCTRKTDSCLIEGKCYTAGESKEAEPHMKCSPVVSGFTWTQEIVV